jgi:predicted DNA-binding transcriptional regulator AlpA
MPSTEDFWEDLIERIAARVAERLPQPPPAPVPPSQAEYLTTKQAAKALALGASTLELWRSKKGKGPEYVKLPGAGGAVRYSVAALDAWLAAHARKPK